MKYKQQTIKWILFVLYISFNLLLLWQHEPWRDEANVWLMARELNPLTLIQEIKYQGHPCLWYLLVMPLAKLGLPFRTIEVLSTLVMCTAAWCILWKAPFHNLLKGVILLAPGCTYFYTCIARNYCLLALLLMVLAWQYEKRFEHPVRYCILIGLLVQADTIGIPIAGFLALELLGSSLKQYWEERDRQLLIKRGIALSIPLLSLLFWMVQMSGVSDSPEYQVFYQGVMATVREVRNFSYVILIRLTGWSQRGCFAFFFCSAVILLLLAFMTKQIWPVITMAGTYLFMAAFSAMIYQLHIWHMLLLLFVCIWMLWILLPKVEYKPVVWASEFWLFVLLAAMFLHWNSEEETSSLQKALTGIYSDAGNVADYIQTEVPEDALIVETNVSVAGTVMAYLPDRVFYYAGTREPLAYADYTEHQKTEATLSEVTGWALKQGYETYYLLDSSYSCITDWTGIEEAKLVYETKEASVRQEDYKLYKIDVEK